MRFQQWQAKLDTSQGKLLPLITISLLCVQILSIARNPIVISQPLPAWLLISDAIFFVFTAGLVLWVRGRTIPERFTHPIAAIAYMIAGLSAVASIAAQADPLPFYFAMAMLGGSFCFPFPALFPYLRFPTRTALDSSCLAIPDAVRGTLHPSRFGNRSRARLLYHAA